MRRREEAWAKLCAYRTLDPNKHGAPGKRPASEDESSRINAPCSATVLPDRGTSVALPASDCTWAVYCNTCDKSLTDTHYHCALCDGGNYDLCETCVGAGIHCPGENHWLIRRYFKDYVLVASETDRVGYKNPSDSASVQPTAPTLPSDAKVSMKTKQDMPSRTCNCCVRSEYNHH